MFSKFIRGVEIVFSKLYWYSEKKTLNECGKNSYMQFPFVLIGGGYIKIGKNFQAYKRLQLEAHDQHNGVCFKPQIVIGDDVHLNYDVHIGAINKITIGDGTLIASKVFITDHFHGNTRKQDLRLPPSKRELYSKGEVCIGNNVWIGEGVAIMPNVTVGNNVIIGANSVVTKDVPNNCIAAGNPARVIRYLEDEEE